MAKAFIKLPPDGAGKQLHTFENANGHNQVMSIGDPNSPDNLQYVDQYGSAYVRFAEGNQIFDSFGKSKTSQETIVGSYIPTYGITEETQGVVNGTAGYVFLPDESALRLSVGTADADLIQMTTHKYHKFFPGTSQLVEITGSTGDSGKANVYRQWGYYDDENGIIFAMHGTEFGIIQRSTTSGTTVDTWIPQSSFNVDKGDGTGISGTNIDPSNVNTYWIDMQWGGRIRVGVYSDIGSRVVFHEIQNANANPAPSFGNMSLPLRVEMFNNGVSASGSEMKVLAATVITESVNLEFRGRCFSTAPWSPSAPITPVVTQTGGAFDTSVSIRPKATLNAKVNRKAIIPSILMISTDKELQLAIIKDATMDGNETWVSVHDNSSVEKSGNVSLVDLGTNDSHFCTLVGPGTHQINLDTSFHYLRKYLKNNADGTQPTYSIVFRTIDGTSATVVAGMTWTELDI